MRFNIWYYGKLSIIYFALQVSTTWQCFKNYNKIITSLIRRYEQPKKILRTTTYSPKSLLKPL